MKRILIASVAFLVAFSVQSSAQTRWGITGGMNFNTSKFAEIDVNARAGWNAGLTCLVDLPLGFSLQPSLVYVQKGANVTDNLVQNMGYVELPVSVQWGPDLLLFRPFVDLTPYIGYALTNRTVLNVSPPGSAGGVTEDKSWLGKERFEYGVGIGGGINVWKLQILARYCWNFGSLYNIETAEGFFKDHFAKLNVESENFGGLTLGVSFLF